MPLSASVQEVQDPIGSGEESDKIYGAARNSNHKHEVDTFFVQESPGRKSGISDQDSNGREGKEETRRSLPGRYAPKSIDLVVLITIQQVQ